MRLIKAALILSAVLAPWSVANAKTATIYIIRHLDTPEGQQDPELTAKGQERAKMLVRWFRGKKLSAVYLTEFRRTRQTVAPLIATRGLTPKVYSPTDPAALLTRVRGESGPVLIVGHSNTVPELVERAGGERPKPLTHPDFGDIWTVRSEFAHDRIGE